MVNRKSGKGSQWSAFGFTAFDEARGLRLRMIYGRVFDVRDQLRLCGWESDVNAIALACSRFQQVQLVAIDKGYVVTWSHRHRAMTSKQLVLDSTWTCVMTSLKRRLCACLDNDHRKVHHDEQPCYFMGIGPATLHAKPGPCLEFVIYPALPSSNVI